MPGSYVIIGTGASGLAAAETIREADPAGVITIFGDDPHGFYSRPGIAYFLTGETSEKQLSLRQGKDFQIVKSSIISINTQSRMVTSANKQNYNYDKLLIATGSTSIKLTIPGAELKGVVKLDNLEDAKEVISIARKSRQAAVIGGGIIALEMVEGLLARGIETHFLLRSDRYWPNVLDEKESEIVEKRLKQHGVHLHYRSQIKQINTSNGKMTSIDTEEGEKIICQLLAVCIGVQPRMELAKGAGLQTDRGILTNEYLQTSAEDIFAAGDAAQVLDPVSGKTTLDALWGTAVAQGRVAGNNMIGKHLAYNKSAAINVTRLAGLTTTIMGAVGQGKKDEDLLTISRGDSESWRQIPNVMAVQRDSDINRTRIMLGTKTFLGAVLMGDQTLSRPLQELISHQVDIKDIIPELLKPDIALADTIINFWLKWSQTREN